MKTAEGPRNVDEYIAGFPENVRIVLERVRSTIRKALPGSEEVISYKIPAFSLNGSRVLYFAGWKQHYSLYPSTRRLESAFKKELAPYEVNGKGTIRFPLSEPVPVRLIETDREVPCEGIARDRKGEVENHAPRPLSAAPRQSSPWRPANDLALPRGAEGPLADGE